MNDKLFEKPVSRKDAGVLAGLWRKILKETNNISAIHYLIARYISKSDKFGGRVSAIKRKNKSSILKNVSDPEMTIKTFFDLLFSLLNVKKITLTVRLTFINGNETIHSIDIDHANYKGDEDDDIDPAETDISSNS